MSRLVAILSGGDWTDARVSHVKIPDSMNLKEEKQRYDHWYQTVYQPAHETFWKSFWGKSKTIPAPQFFTFVEWLHFRGVTLATDLDIEVFEE